MKSNLIKRAVPFVLTLIVGIALTQLITGRALHRSYSSYRYHRVGKTLVVQSVPSIELPAETSDMNGLLTTIKLRALFDADGQVKQIMVPAEHYSVREMRRQYDLAHPEEQRYKTESAKRSAEQTDRLVDSLVNSAIQQLSQATFNPARRRRANVPQWVNVETTFRTDYPVANCDSIRVRISNDQSRVLWEGETLSNRSSACTP